jgi:hypothetical protein
MAMTRDGAFVEDIGKMRQDLSPINGGSRQIGPRRQPTDWQPNFMKGIGCATVPVSPTVPSRCNDF